MDDYLFKKHKLLKLPCSKGHLAGSSPKYRASASAFLPCQRSK